jgi:hypothetical protein
VEVLSATIWHLNWYKIWFMNLSLILILLLLLMLISIEIRLLAITFLIIIVQFAIYIIAINNIHRLRKHALFTLSLRFTSRQNTLLDIVGLSIRKMIVFDVVENECHNIRNWRSDAQQGGCV